MNIGYAVVEHLDKNYDQIVFESNSHYLYGREFRNNIISFAHKMKELGVTPDSFIAIKIGHNDIDIALTLNYAVCLIGCSWTRANAFIMNHYHNEITHIFYSTNGYDDARASYIDESWYERNIEFDFVDQTKPDDVWMVNYSSGTTGLPKTMNITYKNYWHRMFDCDREVDNADRLALLYHPTKSTAMYEVSNAVFNNLPVMLNFKYEDLDHEKTIKLSGSQLQHIGFIGDRPAPAKRFKAIADPAGAALTPEKLKLFLSHFTMCTSPYGSTECGRTSHVLMSEPEQWDGSVGTIMVCTEVQIVDKDHNELPSNTEGIIRIKTPRAIRCYTNSEEATARCFHDGWFYPLDLGYVTDDGRLFITGRIDKSFLNIGGIKINTVDIEKTIMTLPIIDDCSVFKCEDFVVNEQLSAMIVINDYDRTKFLAEIDKPNIDPNNNFFFNFLLAGAVKDVCLYQNNDMAKMPVNIYLVDNITLNDNGKPLKSIPASVLSSYKKIG
jgi:acyl-CoA synthetase (AMP-forming)/AMP-acid ligase II